MTSDVICFLFVFSEECALFRVRLTELLLEQMEMLKSCTITHPELSPATRWNRLTLMQTRYFKHVCRLKMCSRVYCSYFAKTLQLWDDSNFDFHWKWKIVMSHLLGSVPKQYYFIMSGTKFVVHSISAALQYIKCCHIFTSIKRKSGIWILHFAHCATMIRNCLDSLL